MANKKISQLPAISVPLKEDDLFEVAVDNGGGASYTSHSTTGKDIKALVELKGTSYIIVKGDGTATENGLELQAAYDAAKLATPYGNPLSETNRFTILVGGGDYTMSGTPPYAAPGLPYNHLLVDTNFIDIVSLSGQDDVYLSGISLLDDSLYGYSDYKIVGINTYKGPSLGGLFTAFVLYTVENTKIVCENCTGGNFSFNEFSGNNLNSTFINCKAGKFSFSAVSFSVPMGLPFYFNNNSYGTFINCTADSFSFVYNPMTQCSAGGIYTDCVAADESFANNGTSMPVGCIVEGTMTNCKGGDFCFGNTISSGAVLMNCVASNTSFGTWMFYGKTYNCIANGWMSFGNNDFMLTSNVQTGAKIAYCTITSGEFHNPAPITNVIFACNDITGLKTY